MREGQAGARDERRAFTAAVAVTFGAVVCLMLLASPHEVEGALRASVDDARSSVRSSAPALARVEGDVPELALREPVQPASLRVELASPAADARVPGWVEDLRDDDVPNNARRAILALQRCPPGDLPELEQALGSYDLQLRHFAGFVLRCRVLDDRAEATDRLMAVTVDALRSDINQRVPGVRTTIPNDLAPLAARFLAPRAAAAQRWLEQALFGSDAQQRFLCAYLLAQGGLDQHREPIFYELFEHLNDNQIGSDALMAAHGLFRLGTAVTPLLEAHWSQLDEQGQRLARLIQQDVATPPRNEIERRVRGRRVKVSSVYLDPVFDYDITRSVVPRFRR